MTGRVTGKASFVVVLLLLAFASSSEGGRGMSSKVMVKLVDHPQNFFGGASAGSFSNPGFGFGFSFGPSGFCARPGFGCLPVAPFNPGDSLGAGGGSP
uniref:Uncharacterized protein n=1 Tax=Nelumbo nucifera TaxID=4432 RepID=A0A822Z0V3_NELNU|nr:TPA_asm: hypothetical protein HUJ06_009048 [Nelumbo nucifera]